MTPRRSILALTAALALGLTACTVPPAAPGAPEPAPASAAPAPTSDNPPGDADQSVEDACAVVQSSIGEATGAFDAASADDPGAVVEAMRTASDELAMVSSEVTNEEVAALLPAVQDMFSQAAEVISALAAGDTARLTELDDVATSVAETQQRFEAVCSPE